jgi:hypothetical protein
MRIKRIFQRYPIASYFVLAFMISWGGSIAFRGAQYLGGEPMGVGFKVYFRGCSNGV